MAVAQLPSGHEMLIVVAEFPSSAPEQLFDYWTQPALLQQWWPQKAELQPEVDGIYHLSWPQMNWHLRGRYTFFKPGKMLAFTWKWDHDAPDAVEREVSITFEPLVHGGTSLMLTHGVYANTEEEQELRVEHHLAGWMHFLPRLVEMADLGWHSHTKNSSARGDP